MGIFKFFAYLVKYKKPDVMLIIGHFSVICGKIVR